VITIDDKFAEVLPKDFKTNAQDVAKHLKIGEDNNTFEKIWYRLKQNESGGLWLFITSVSFNIWYFIL